MKNDLKIGQKYVVNMEINGFTCDFVKGEILTLDKISYSPYDNGYVYAFHDELLNNRKLLVQEGFNENLLLNFQLVDSLFSA